MTQAKFRDGKRVTLAEELRLRLGPGPYEIVRRMPDDSVEPRYLIRDIADQRERVVDENDIVSHDQTPVDEREWAAARRRRGPRQH